MKISASNLDAYWRKYKNKLSKQSTTQASKTFELLEKAFEIGFAIIERERQNAKLCIQYIKEAEALNDRYPSHFISAKISFYKGRYHSEHDETEEGIQCLEEALKSLSQVDSRDKHIEQIEFVAAAIYVELGIANGKLSRYEKTVEYNRQAIQIYENSGPFMMKPWFFLSRISGMFILLKVIIKMLPATTEKHYGD
ncbi:MAG: hypothetical protein SFU91_08025 [Chloroherpetonaceae bacterium]|nr:hypothetical protein [Chloroherpetonaceae bacterium]